MTLAPGRRVLLLVPARSYRAADFVLAAVKMGLDLTVASDGALPIGGPVLPVRPGDPDHAAGLIASGCGPLDAVVAADAPMLPLAALVAERLGLPHNPVDAVLAASDKARQRRIWAAAGVAQPRFEIIACDDAIEPAVAGVGFPCVIKAVSLSASQGVLRADDAAQAVRAAARIRRVLSAVRGRADGGKEPLLAEEYLPGPELSIDGLLTDGRLTPLAVFDKPAMPDGPTFEETLLVTPSRLPGHIVADAIRTAADAARALGLRTGPVHAELRVTGTGAAMIELAARSIGGLCSRALRFPGGRTLEELILASALGDPPPAGGEQAPPPSGVFMLPVPRAGVLHAVEGRAAAEAVPGITGVSITIPAGRRVRPLPDGDQYLGFIFAEAGTPGEVEKALITASQHVHAVYDMGPESLKLRRTNAVMIRSF